MGTTPPPAPLVCISRRMPFQSFSREPGLPKAGLFVTRKRVDVTPGTSYLHQALYPPLSVERSVPYYGSDVADAS